MDFNIIEQPLKVDEIYNLCKLNEVFDQSNRDLKGVKVQLMPQEGCGKDETLILKISDGKNRIKTTLKLSYKIYFVGRMFQDQDIFQILQ